MNNLIKKGNSKDFQIQQIIKYKYFIYNQFIRNISVIYKQTAFGPIWIILVPIIQSGLFSFLFSGIAKLPTDGIPAFLFYYISLMHWNFFQSSVIKNSNCFSNYGSFLRNAYVPKLCFSFSILLENFFLYLINLCVFIILLSIYYFQGYKFQLNFSLIIYYPLMLLYISIFGSIIGLIAAFASITFRDIRILIPNFMQLLFFCTPIVYSFNLVDHKLHFFYYINPIAYSIDFFKNCFFSIQTINISYFISSFIIFIISSFIMLLIGKKVIGSLSDNV